MELPGPDHIFSSGSSPPEWRRKDRAVSQGTCNLPGRLTDRHFHCLCWEGGRLWKIPELSLQAHCQETDLIYGEETSHAPSLPILIHRIHELNIDMTV